MKQFILLLLCLLPALVLTAQTTTPELETFKFKIAKNTNPDLRPGAPLNGSLEEALSVTFDSMVALTPVKGFNAAMLLPNGTIWKQAGGLAQELPSPIALDTEDLMGMGSISKSFVSATLLQLIEDGLLSLDDSIGKFAGPYPNVPGYATIRQLLSHRSGIGDYLNENPLTTQAWINNLDSIWAMDTVLQYFVPAPNFPVGTNWSYSNTNYLLAGKVIETVTGRPWYELLREKVLTPLNLSHTYVYPWETPPVPLAHVWLDVDGNGTVEDGQGLGLPDQGLFSLASSAGCLVTTPEDLVRFSERIYSGNLLQPATLDEMQTNYLPAGATGVKYGLGAAFFDLPQQLDNWGHNGDLIYKSFALYFPTEHMALAVQQNDDREHDPGVPGSPRDLYDVFLALLDTYLNYNPPSATHEVNDDLVFKPIISPNPVGDSFLIHFAEPEQPTQPFLFTLLNATGQTVVKQVVTENDTRIQTSGLPEGIYIFHAGGHAGALVKKAD